MSFGAVTSNGLLELMRPAPSSEFSTMLTPGCNTVIIPDQLPLVKLSEDTGVIEIGWLVPIIALRPRALVKFVTTALAESRAVMVTANGTLICCGDETGLHSKW